ncbi:MFS transporter [Sulfolobus sp. A20-N-F6]|nr:MFS transporter [Sulfolobus sp. A20-N-F6]
MAEGRTLITLALTAFLDSVGFGIIIPILPYYSLKLGATPIEFSLLTVAYSIGQLIFSPYISRLSDIRGKKTVLLLGISSEVVGYLIIGLSPFFYLLLLARFITGSLTSNLPVILSYVTSIDEERMKSRNIGIISGSFGVGFVAGPIMGGALSPLGYRNTFIIVSILSLINLLSVLLTLKDENTGVIIKQSSLKDILKMSSSFFILILTVTLSFAILQGTLAFYGKYFYEWGPQQIGLILGIVGTVQAIVQFLLVYRLIGIVGEKVSTVIGLLVSLFAYALLLFPINQNLTYISLVTIAIGNGIVQNSILTLLSKSISSGNRGGAFGFTQSSTALGSLIGFPLGNFMFQFVSASSEYVLSSVLILISLSYFYRTYMRGISSSR